MTGRIVRLGGWNVRLATELGSAMWPLDRHTEVDWEYRAVPILPQTRGTTEVLWSSSQRLPSGAPVQRIRANRRLTRVYVEFSEVCTFLLTPRRTWVEVLDPQYRFMAEIRLLGYILGIRHELNGTPVLHAGSLVAQSGVGIVVCGEKGAGKSMLALNALRAGWRMAGDDIVPLVADSDGKFEARAAYPQLRLWGRDVAAFGLGPADVVHIHPWVDKKGIPLSRIGGNFHPDPAPVGLVALLTRRDPGDESQRDLAVLRPAEAVFALCDNVFLKHLAVPLGWVQRHLGFFARLASSIPVVKVPAELLESETRETIERLHQIASGSSAGQRAIS